MEFFLRSVKIHQVNLKAEITIPITPQKVKCKKTNNYSKCCRKGVSDEIKGP